MSNVYVCYGLALLNSRKNEIMRLDIVLLPGKHDSCCAWRYMSDVVGCGNAILDSNFVIYFISSIYICRKYCQCLLVVSLLVTGQFHRQRPTDRHHLQRIF